MNIKADLGFFCCNATGDIDPNQHLQDLELDNYLKSPDRNDSFGANSSERKDCMNKTFRLGHLVCIKNMFFFIFPN